MWLRLPSLKKEDRDVAFAYNIKCSTSVSLTPNIKCYRYENLEDLNPSRIRLILPDATRMFYAAVRIVRNFDGRKILENNYSFSNPFCPGKQLFIAICLMFLANFSIFRLIHKSE